MNTRPCIPLCLRDLNPDPLRQFQIWFDEAHGSGLSLPEAMTLATAGRNGRPAARIVLLRGVDERGFVFFTNYQSGKAQDIEENPQAALAFHWPEPGRQVRIEGIVEKVEESISDDYFAQRPRGHQIGAHASAQSRVIPDRNVLEQQFAQVTRTFAKQQIPRPAHWGGYRVVPDLLEFWQVGDNRLHDRFRYRRDPHHLWVVERLAP